MGEILRYAQNDAINAFGFRSIEEIKLGNYDVLVMTSPDRLSRGYALHQRLIREMREMGVQVVYTHDDVTGVG